MICPTISEAVDSLRLSLHCAPKSARSDPNAQRSKYVQTGEQFARGCKGHVPSSPASGYLDLTAYQFQEKNCWRCGVCHWQALPWCTPHPVFNLIPSFKLVGFQVYILADSVSLKRTILKGIGSFWCVVCSSKTVFFSRGMCDQVLHPNRSLSKQPRTSMSFISAVPFGCRLIFLFSSFLFSSLFPISSLFGCTCACAVTSRLKACFLCGRVLMHSTCLPHVSLAVLLYQYKLQCMKR